MTIIDEMLDHRPWDWACADAAPADADTQPEDGAVGPMDACAQGAA